jgi:NAD(P)-dependent dehydrogenase (short-subunit alcohol dehydrogenase family)
MKLNGKVALISGAASGIGHAIVKRYVEADGRVVIADLDPAKAAQAASELGNTKTAIGIRMDVSNEARREGGNARRDRRQRVHDGRGHRRDRAVAGRLQDQCSDRRVDYRQPWVAHELIGRQFAVQHSPNGS